MIYAIVMAVVVLFYPHHFIFGDVRFLGNHDTEIPFQNTFALVSQFLNGGIQLFDRFDQINYAYAHLTTGFYTIINVVVAFLYTLCSSFFAFPGEAFHHFYSVVFYALTIALRCVGGYLLLRRWTDNWWVIMASLVCFNTLLSSQMMNNGIFTNNLYSYLPLLLYFLLRFFEFYKLNDFLAFLLVMTIAVANSPLFALGYFYPVVHGFILAAVVAALIRWILRRERIYPKMITKAHIFRIGLCVTVCVGIILPNILWLKSLNEDFYVAGSGLGETQGRIGNAFHIDRYFQVAGKSFANPLDWPFESIDYTHTVWPSAWMFLGCGVLIICLFGLILVRDYRKFIFLAAIAWVILLNIPPYPGNVTGFLDWHNSLKPDQIFIYLLMFLSGIVHWLNVLTNPFSFLMRSFHMSTLLMPFLFLPLFALGLLGILQSIKDNRPISIQRKSILLAVIILAACVVGGLADNAVKAYAETQLVLAFVLGVLICRPWPGRFKWAVAVLIIMAALDLVAFHTYINNNNDPSERIRPRVYEGLPNVSKVILDYQNPHILPWREYLWTASGRFSPALFTYQNTYGFFYHYMPLERFLTEPDLYQPLPKIYQGLYADVQVRSLINSDERFVSFWHVDVNGQKEDWSAFILPPAQVRTFPLLWAKAKKQAHEQGIIYQWALPDDFPVHFASAVFTQDRLSVAISIDGKMLEPAQGALVNAGTFDINNRANRSLSILMPGDFKPSREIIDVQIKLPQGMRAITDNRLDRIGFNYQAPGDGWMVVRYPYDAKWQLTVDGKRASIIPVQKYFIGFPLSAGEHKIVLEYWPSSPLRWLIALSLILTVLGLLYVVKLGFRQIR